MHWIDWSIVCSLILGMTCLALYTQKYSRNAADFLVANRCAGRYLLCAAEGIAAMGAVTVIAWSEMYYSSGFTPAWWKLMMIPCSFIITLSGWIIYRYRQTRAMTLAQFFELRYSRAFRIYAGSIIVVSGLLNFGIAPAIGARFFIYFIDLPEQFQFLGLTLPTIAPIMLVLIGVSVLLTYLGGQIAVIVTDFVQGVFANIVYVIILLFLIIHFDWSQIAESLVKYGPETGSLVHPFKTDKVEGFSFWFFAIGIVGAFYNYMSWQGTQGYNASARNPHEAKMAKIFGVWRSVSMLMLFMFLPVCAYTFLHHPDFAQASMSAKNVLDAISNEAVRRQMIVPMSIKTFLPVGLLGAFFAVMLSAFITTHDTFLHSWGSIFMQDVVLPLRKKPLSPEKHVKLLRLAVLGVAIFVFFFSLFFPIQQYIFMWFAVTGAIFMGGSGALIIGGLYWKKGTTSAAFVSLTVGSTLSVAGIILGQVWPNYHDGAKFPINGQWMYMIAMLASIVSYLVISLLTCKKPFNLDKLLHRGKYAIKDDYVVKSKKQSKLAKAFGISEEFSLADKIIFWASVIWAVGWFSTFLIGSIYNLTHDVADSSWCSYWHVVVWINIIVGTTITIWLLVGGVKDFRYLFNFLKRGENSADDGQVHNGSDEQESCEVESV